MYKRYFFNILFSSILTVLLAGCTPSVTIIEPVSGDKFEFGEEITFRGEAADQQHPNLDSGAFVWTSDKDGEIGTGTSLKKADLSAGEHVITLTVTYPDGQSGQSSVSITISNDSAPTTTTTTAASGDRFIDNNDGTVTDTRTGLIWLKNANPCGTKNWADAGTYCGSLASGTAGLTEGSTAGQWRLPSLEELQEIGTDPPTTWATDSPPVTWTMPGAPFIGVQSNNYWSSTSYAPDPTLAWSVYMGKGSLRNASKSTINYAWPVRDGN
ncbi:MAG: DUF1566 domain-containing protein [Pseudomonadota bacterium]